MDEEELKKQQDEEQDQMLIQDLGLPPQIYYGEYLKYTTVSQ